MCVQDVVNYALEHRHVKIVPTGLEFGVEGPQHYAHKHTHGYTHTPIGFTHFRGKHFHPTVNLTRRYYPHAHNLDGFFVRCASCVFFSCAVSCVCLCEHFVVSFAFIHDSKLKKYANGPRTKGSGEEKDSQANKDSDKTTDDSTDDTVVADIAAADDGEGEGGNHNDDGGQSQTKRVKAGKRDRERRRQQDAMHEVTKQLASSTFDEGAAEAKEHAAAKEHANRAQLDAKKKGKAKQAKAKPEKSTETLGSVKPASGETDIQDGKTASASTVGRPQLSSTSPKTNATSNPASWPPSSSTSVSRPSTSQRTRKTSSAKATATVTPTGKSKPQPPAPTTAAKGSVKNSGAKHAH